MTSRELYQGYIDGFTPDPIVDACEWMQKNWKLTSGGSGEAGDWRIERVPYTKQILEWLSPQHPARKIVIQKTVQSGISEIANGWLGYTIDLYPSAGMYVLPTIDLSEEHNRVKIFPSLEANPRLSDKIIRSLGRQSGSSVSRIVYRGGSIKFTGANSETGTRNKSIRYLVGDDLNGWPSELGEIGDTVAAFEDRTTAFPNNKKILLISTPTITVDGGSQGLIEREYLLSSQGEYYIPCPECEEFFILKFEHLVYKSEGIQRQGEVTASCPHCGGIIPEYKRLKLANKGKVIEKFPERETKGLKGFFGLSPFVSWEEIIDKYLIAAEAYERGDNAKIRTWTNNLTAETWRETKTKIDTNIIMERAEDYSERIIPRKAYLLTAGVDIQKNRIEMEVVAWGRDRESWSIDYLVLHGDTLRNEIWQELDEKLNIRYQWANTGEKLKIVRTLIDTGGGSKDAQNDMITSTFMAYSFVRGKDARGIFGTKGVPGRNGSRILAPRSTQLVDSVGGDKTYGQVTLIPCYVDTLKDILHDILQITEAGPNYCHFPKRYEAKYYEGLTAEYKDDKGKWARPRGKYNEPTDCRNYATAAMETIEGDINNKETFLNQYCDFMEGQLRAKGIKD